MSNNSLAFRHNEEKILSGIIPTKYKKILKHVEGNNILEVGAAEGVLSLLVAKENPNRHVIGLERHSLRYETSIELQKRWAINNCKFIKGEFIENFHLLKGIDTFIGIRTIYYFLHDTDKIFSEISKNCSRLILGGNANRSFGSGAKRSIKGITEISVSGLNPNLDYAPYQKVGRNPNYYASARGMEEIGKKYGYETELLINETNKIDPLYVGTKK